MANWLSTPAGSHRFQFSQELLSFTSRLFGSSTFIGQVTLTPDC
jgi:hypothetical protein